MTVGQLKEQLGQILDDASSEWCGCMEGDMSDNFPQKKAEVINQVVALFNQAFGDANQINAAAAKLEAEAKKQNIPNN